ncbi:MAG: hypothetical protein ACJASQ_000296 [Crocinitomicaceae bacterium]|jgi:hypothetical protein
MTKFKIILTLAIALVSSVSHAGRKEFDRLPIVELQSTAVDSTLSNSETKYIFTFQSIAEGSEVEQITFSMDGFTQTADLDHGKRLTLVTVPGKHVFQFYYSSKYYEVDSDSLYSAPGHSSNYSVYLLQAVQPTLMRKPIIYLYPETDTLVTVTLEAQGELTFTYPEYKDGWEFMARPNGDLAFGDDTYNYLFWEADQSDHLSTADLNEGFIVKGENSISFLEAKLNTAGFTSKEKADFITFWGPLIQQNELNFVRFEFNEVCDKFAELNITPTPDHIYRLYIFFSPIEEAFEVVEQQIPKMNRNGFTVLEWGGQVSLSIAIKPTNI